MKQKGVVVLLMGLFLVFSFAGLVYAQNGAENGFEKNHSEGIEGIEGVECALDSDCAGGNFCENGECEKIDYGEEPEEEFEEELEIEEEFEEELKIEEEFEEELEIEKEGIKYKYKYKNELGEEFEFEYEEKVGEEGEAKVKFNGNEIKTKMELKFENFGEENISRIMTMLSNGKNAEVKIMPEVASERAIERLGLKNCNESLNCTIELKEVGEGEEMKIAYEMKAKKDSKLFGFIKTKIDVSTEIDAETGEILNVKKSWWAFLASGFKEKVEEEFENISE